jgi:two-component system sensor histidine kinase AtoS
MKRESTERSQKRSFAEDLIECIPIGMMVLDQEGRIIRMNRRQEEISQVSREAILGRPFHEAFPKTLEQGLLRPYWRLLKRGIPFDVIIDRYIPQYYAKQMTYHARGAALTHEGRFVLLHDLEEELYHVKRLVEKRTRELNDSKNFLESLIDSSPNIVISTDLRGRILIFNKTAERTFGYSEDEVLKRRIESLVRGPSAFDAEPREKWGGTREVLCIRKDQSDFPASVSVSDVRNAGGKRIGRLYLLTDLTEKKAIEERLLLSEKLALYTELMGGIAHQLNNPLIGVINFSEMLLKEMDPEDPKRELGETISRAGKECLRIITSVLNCIKDPHLTFTTVDVRDVVRSAIISLSEHFGDRLSRVTIRTGMDDQIPPIQGDGIQLKQCFLNILMNAVQAMEGGGELTVETRHDPAEGVVRVLFSDTGVGIPEEHLERVFLPFFSMPKLPGKHGLGLSFAYQIVRNHRGDIRVRSEVGKGTTFVILIPIDAE